MSSAEESPAQQAARRRRERREAKLKADGSARLDKITSLSGKIPVDGTIPLVMLKGCLSLFGCVLTDFDSQQLAKARLRRHVLPRHLSCRPPRHPHHQHQHRV